MAAKIISMETLASIMHLMDQAEPFIDEAIAAVKQANVAEAAKKYRDSLVFTSESVQRVFVEVNEILQFLNTLKTILSNLRSDIAAMRATPRMVRHWWLMSSMCIQSIFSRTGAKASGIDEFIALYESIESSLVSALEKIQEAGEMV